MRPGFFAWLGGIALGMLVIPSAWAYRVATLQSDAKVHRASEPDSETIEELTSGTRLYTSDRPSGDFYKVKTPSGKIGWIPEAALRFDSPLPEAKTANAPSEAEESNRERLKKRRSDRNTPHALRLLGDMNFFNLSSYSSTYQTDALTNGIGLGAEFSLPLASDFSLLLRGERINKGVSVDVTDLNLGYDLTVSSIPVMTGVDYRFFSEGAWQVGIAALGGIGLGTAFTVGFTKPAGTAGSQLKYSGSPVTFLGRVGVEYKTSSSFGWGLEAGYRYLKLTRGTLTSTSSSGKSTTLDSSGAQDLNLSGMVAGLMASFWF